MLGANESATEISLTENVVRVPVHPADQFETFAEFVHEGNSVDDVAARFGVTPTFVEQRLKLASVSPRLIVEYRSGAMTLEQLTAFTLSDSHALQEEVWFEHPYAEMPARAIRHLLTRSQVDAADRRARFIGIKAYQKAGGVILRDLFHAEDEGYFSDSQFLDVLVFEKLETAAQSIRAEGWQWVGQALAPNASDAPGTYVTQLAGCVCRHDLSAISCWIVAIDNLCRVIDANLPQASEVIIGVDG